MRRLAQFAVIAVLGAGAAGPLSAQVLGIPYYVNPRGGLGILAAANAGVIASPSSSKGAAIALTGGVGAGPLFLTASVSQFNPKGAGSNLTSYGGTAGMKLFGGGLVPVAIGVQAGVGYWKVSGGPGYTTIPVALGIGLNVPLFPIKPWIAPRIEFDRQGSYAGYSSSSTTRVGVSVGTDFNLLLGLGLHAAVDYLPKKTGSTPLPSQTTLGVGVHFNFHVPMM